MKNMWENLNPSQKKELDEIVKKIVQEFSPVQIFCFGSRVSLSSRNSCFTSSEKQEECNYDFLVITPSSTRQENELQNFVSSKYKNGTITIVNYSNDMLAGSLAIGQKFTTTIVEKGIILYGPNQLNESYRPLKRLERNPDKLKESLELSFKNAWGFIDAAVERSLNENYNLTVVLVYHALEQACRGALEIFLGYRPSHQSLENLMNLCDNFKTDLSGGFQRDTRVGKKLFKALISGYSKAQLDVRFEVEKELALKLLKIGESYIEMVEGFCKIQLIKKN